MSLTSYRAAPPRVGVVWVGWKTWRRPTFPRLETQYHRRWGFSRPSSGWDRVRAPRHGHQVVQPTLVWWGTGSGDGVLCAVDGVLQLLVWMTAMHGAGAHRMNSMGARSEILSLLGD